MRGMKEKGRGEGEKQHDRVLGEGGKADMHPDLSYQAGALRSSVWHQNEQKIGERFDGGTQRCEGEEEEKEEEEEEEEAKTREKEEEDDEEHEEEEQRPASPPPTPPSVKPLPQPPPLQHNTKNNSSRYLSP